MPEVPFNFLEFQSMSLAELQQLQSSTLLLDDWLVERPAACALRKRMEEARQENSRLAKEILGREAAFHEVGAAFEESREALLKCREPVEALERQRDAISARLAPDRMAGLLAAKSHEADAEAEEALQEALATSGPMSAAALTKFRQQYEKLKADKHRRLALKEALEKGGP